MALAKTLIERLSAEVSGDVIVLADNTDYSNAYELAIEDAMAFVMGDIPDRALWAFSELIEDDGNGVEIPNEKDWNFPIGGIYDEAGGRYFAREGREDLVDTYWNPRERYWFYNQKEKRVYIRPCGGYIAMVSISKEDFGFNSNKMPRLKGLAYAFMRMLVSKSAEYYLENQITKLFQGLIYNPGEIENKAEGILIPAISDFPEYTAETSWPDVPKLVGNQTNGETIEFPSVVISSHTVASFTGEFPKDPNDPTKDYPIPDLDPFPAPPPDVEDLMAKPPKFGNPPRPLPDDDDNIYLGELPEKPDEEEFEFDSRFLPEDVPEFPNGTFVQAPTIYSGAKATHTKTVPNRDGVTTVGSRDKPTKNVSNNLLTTDDPVKFTDAGNSPDEGTAYIGSGNDQTLAKETGTIIEDNPDYDKGTDGLSDFMDNEDLEQFQAELNRLDSLLQKEVAQLNESGSNVERYQSLTQRLSTIINAAVSNAQTLQNTFAAQLESH